MRSQAFLPALTSLAWAVALACAGSTPAAAERTPADSARSLKTSHQPIDRDHLHLARAAMEQSLGNLRGVVENLEATDFTANTPSAEADRAAFLLGQAYLRLGSLDRFVELARAVSRWDRQSPYTQWLAYELLLVRFEGGESPRTPPDRSAAAGGVPGAPPTEELSAGTAAANALAAALLLRQGDPAAASRLLAERGPSGAPSPLTTYLKALALARTGGDDTAELTVLSTADTTTTLGRDLAGAALVERATRALARDQDARALLESVPAGSRYAPRARHMLGLLALEHGEAEQGAQILESLLAGDSSYTDRREVRLALAGQALEQGRWDVALGTYRDIDQDWAHHRDALQHLLAEDSFDTLWSAWQSNLQFSEALVLDALPARMLAERLATASTDLASRPAPDLPELGAPQPAGASPWPVAPPAPDDWSAVAMAERRAGEAAGELERTRWAEAREREGLEHRRRYLGIGLERARREAEQLQARTALLDSLRSTLAALDARLRSVRDEESRRVAARTAAILEACARNVRWMHAMRQLYLDGSDPRVPVGAPGGFPGPDSLLSQEEALARAIQDMVELTAAEAPGLIARSYEDAWRPNLIDRAIAQGAEAGRALAWARALEASIDSSLAASSGSAALRRLGLRLAAFERTTDSLRAAHAALRARVARRAVERALASLEAEREAIDYGLAASAYGLSVRSTGPESSDAGAAIARGQGSVAADTLDRAQAPGDTLEDPEAARERQQAIVMLQAFLEHHPHSPARAEMRFRLADLLLMDARQRFREQMAEYVRDPSEGRARGRAVPVLTHAAALDLYRKILAEDPDFSHRDAVLFNAGMILADEADPEAARFFQDLVTAHPQSPYCQEAYLRMGDMEFNQSRFHGGVESYQRAAAGPDPGLRVIALYKMGWAHFNEDRFLEAADAFRAVLDLYGSEHRAEIQADIEGEAEAYLVHSLAGAGGARAFADYFDRIGARPYERHVLLALGQHFRRYDQFPEAAAADTLCIRRYPLHADALISAQRLVETYQRSERLALEQEARLTYAPRFAPGSDWFVAQTSDSVRAAGAAFARSSWKAVALEHHREARESGSREEWQQALRLYETLLAIWPKDDEAPTFELHAGEASARLGDHAAALRHYRTTAESGPDSLAALALWQCVAVTDAWYESTRAAAPRDRAALGRDSLAQAVIEAGDRLLARFPDHPNGADIAWRQGQLAFAHRWFDRAAQDLGRIATRYPDDERAPVAASQRGDALFQLGEFEAAGAALEDALAAARRAGRDSLARRAEKAIPICYYRQAEAAVAADSTQYRRHAELFERVASRWPGYEHADLAEYRAGLAYLKAGQPREAVRAMQTLIRQFPRSEYARDAHLQVARTWEGLGERELAAQAYAEFARGYPDDESARGAWLKAADLLAAAGLSQRAESLRLDYIRRYPDDFETAMEILEELARRDLASVGPEHPISTLLGASSKARPAAAPPSRLAAYLHLASAHPGLASRGLLAQVRFLQGEEARPAYAAARLRQPLARSIPPKQRLLDTLITRYRRSANLGVPDWAHASAFRIGQALVAFGEALEHCEPPADLQGDDLLAYEDVLMKQSQTFYDRGEGVWTDLLRGQGREATDDSWISQTQASLWQRLSKRFFYLPEVEFPLVGATPPGRDRAEKDRPEQARDASREDSGAAPSLARREGRPR